jgi:hypothetical protein
MRRGARRSNACVIKAGWATVESPPTGPVVIDRHYPQLYGGIMPTYRAESGCRIRFKKGESPERPDLADRSDSADSTLRGLLSQRLNAIFTVQMEHKTQYQNTCINNTRLTETLLKRTDSTPYILPKLYATFQARQAFPIAFSATKRVICALFHTIVWSGDVSGRSFLVAFPRPFPAMSGHSPFAKVFGDEPGNRAAASAVGAPPVRRDVGAERHVISPVERDIEGDAIGLRRVRALRRIATESLAPRRFRAFAVLSIRFHARILFSGVASIPLKRRRASARTLRGMDAPTIGRAYARRHFHPYGASSMRSQRYPQESRVCAAVGCARPVDRLYLFCRPHYWRLEKALQSALHDSCKPGSGREHRPCRPWLEAAACCVEYLANLEGLAPANRYRDALASVAFVEADSDVKKASLPR